VPVAILAFGKNARHQLAEGERDVRRIANALALATLVAASATWVQTVAEAQETSKEIIADQIRRQGFTCDKPESAKRDPERSKPSGF
jgi:hypothetical protein